MRQNRPLRLLIATVEASREPHLRIRVSLAIGQCIAIVGLLFAWLGSEAACQAAVIVLANRTPDEIACTLAPAGEAPYVVKIAAGDVKPVVQSQACQARFIAEGKKIERLMIEPNAAYFFFRTAEGHVGLHRIGLGADQNIAGPLVASTAAPIAPSQSDGIRHTASRPTTGIKSAPTKPKVTTIPVKILVDEEERASEAAWHKRLSGRIQAASNILEQHCFIRLEVIDYGTWQSDNSTQDFVRSLGEFEQEAELGRARLAIGFTSQYHLPQGRTHLGGTRGPLHSHLLMREWSQHFSEPERLEILLHELGHVFGSVHSPEQDSVMRPVLGDRLSRAAKFRIGFDPVNTLAMCLVSEQLAQRPGARLAELSPECRLRLAGIYAEIAKALPDDPAAKQYLGLIEQTGFGLHLRVQDLQGGKPQPVTGAP